MKYSKLLMAAVASALTAGSAHAAICAMDQKPAATLLIPYFEMEIAKCNQLASARTTTFWVRNTASTPQLAQVTLWSNAGIPAVGFQVYLPPLAAQRVNLADVLCSGTLPRSGRAVSTNSPFDTSATNINYPACNNGSNPDDGTPVANQLSAEFTFELQGRLSGRRSIFANGCYGVPVEASPTTGDPVARGYITIDDVTQCGGSLPTDPGYFIGGGLGIAGVDNVYVGGWQIVDPAQNFAFGGAAIGVEASPGAFPPGHPTFYGHFVNGTSADDREPLPATWAVQGRDGGVFDDRADVLLWSDQPKRNPSTGLCSGVPNPPFASPEDQRLFDATGESEPPPPVFPGKPTPFPSPLLGTQRVRMSALEDTSNVTGNTLGALAYWNDASFNSFYGVPAGQAWLATVQSSEGRYADVTPGVSIGSTCEPSITAPADAAGPKEQNPTTRQYIFQDGFED